MIAETQQPIEVASETRGNITEEEEKAVAPVEKDDTKYRGLTEYRKKVKQIKDKRKQMESVDCFKITKSSKAAAASTAIHNNDGGDTSSLDSSFASDAENSPADEVDKSKVPGVARKSIGKVQKKRYARNPLYKKVLKVVSISQPQRLEYTDDTVTPVDEIITKKLYKLKIKWLGGDHKIHVKTITFGQRPDVVLGADGKTVIAKVYPDFIGHGDEAKRCSTQVRFRKNPGYTPLEPNFYKQYLLNNLPTIEESFEDMKNTVLKKAYQFAESSV